MMNTVQPAPVEGRPKLLFADDHHLLLDALAFVAGSEFEVAGVDSLAAFEAKLEQFCPDAAVLDVRMPDGDGLEVARGVLSRRPDLKLMFLSMHTEPKIVKRAMDLGARAYLSKRAPAEELLAAIRTVLAGGKHFPSPAVSAFNEPVEENALTERQKEVLRLISHGCSAKEIASRLNISVRTAEFHRAAIMDRLKLHSTAMMTRYAVERGVA
jgi:DNA-binding NarL/FixJ family response regulator